MKETERKETTDDQGDHGERRQGEAQRKGGKEAKMMTMTIMTMIVARFVFIVASPVVTAVSTALPTEIP